MNKKQIGRILYILAIVLLIVFGFMRPALRNNGSAGNDDIKTLQEVQVENEEGVADETSNEAVEATAEPSEVESIDELADSNEGQNIEEAIGENEINEATITDEYEEVVAQTEEVIDESLSLVEAEDSDDEELNAQNDLGITEDGQYSSKDEVALYIHTYGHLPSNYITKNEAKDLGWGDKGTLNKVAPGMSIGGDNFGNREGLLPKEKGRKYYECDIDYKKGGRNAKRIIYSNDGLIFYTDDHYESFEQLY